MSMSKRMIAIFFLMILLIVVINTYYLSVTNIAGSDEFTADRFHNMASNMVRNIEQYINLMDLALEDLVSDTGFMEAFYQISIHGDSDPAAARNWQNKMSDTLHHSATSGSFYRVSIFSENGFYLSNHIDRNDSLVSMSEEAQDLILSLPLLIESMQSPFQRQISGVHRDPFTLSRDVNVFSSVQSISFHGQHVGFIDVSADAGELANLFRTDNPNVMVHAVLQNGRVLYSTDTLGAVYQDIPLNAYQKYTDEKGVSLNVYHIQSRWLGLDIYLSQDASVRSQMLWSMITRYIRFSLVVAAAALVLVVLVSMGLTRSIRQLSDKVQSLSAERLMMGRNPPTLDTFVTSSKDPEIHNLEKEFNALVAKLQNASQNEIAMRQSTTNARLNALQAQINPHFVYNTLNIIAAKGLESGNEDVMELCAQFAQMLRYSTDTRSKSVYVWEDVEHVTNYLLLLKARFEDSLEYTIEIPDEMRNIKIPRLTLQPLVENSIAHGFDDGIDVRRIHIRGQIQNNEMLLQIRDNGQGFPPDVLAQLQADIEAITTQPGREPENNGHIGLLNTCWRLRHYSAGAPITMQVMNDNGALVQLRIPIEQSATEKSSSRAAWVRPI